MIRPITQMEEAPQITTPVQSVQERLSVLVAEDNIVNQMVIKNFIDSTFYDVCIVGDGAQAVEYYKHNSPALIFMDLSMPVMDGYAATAQIREIEKTENRVHIPIIATTAHVLEEDQKRCRSAQMDDFLSKPINNDALGEILLRWTSHARRQSMKAG